VCPGLKVPICRLKHWTEKNGGCAGAFCIAFWCCGYGSEVRCYHIFITQFSTESVLQDKQRLLKHLESEARNFPDSLWQLREARQWIRVKVGYPPCIWYWKWPVKLQVLRAHGPIIVGQLIIWSTWQGLCGALCISHCWRGSSRLPVRSPCSCDNKLSLKKSRNIHGIFMVFTSWEN